MTSERKIQANRQNSRASTGPKTAKGRARSAQNARRHGLSLSVFFNAALSKDVEVLARELAGPDAKAHVLERARRLAETQIDLCRVRYAQHQLLSSKLSDPYYDSRSAIRRKLSLLGSFLRKDRANTPLPSVVANFVTTTPQGSEKLALIFTQERNLRALDRYEQRALSRRRFAIRKLDEARLLDRRVTIGKKQSSAISAYVNDSQRRAHEPTNKMTRNLKVAAILAAEAIGEDRKGTNGLMGYLKNAAVEQPKAYLQLLGKVLPMPMTELSPPLRVNLATLSVEEKRRLFREEMRLIKLGTPSNLVLED